MKTFNYCIHGFAINEFCSDCELTILDFEAWLGFEEIGLDKVSIYVPSLLKVPVILQSIN
jgi:hypothetical protein